jgi:hypothetical protein
MMTTVVSILAWMTLELQTSYLPLLDEDLPAPTFEPCLDITKHNRVLPSRTTVELLTEKWLPDFTDLMGAVISRVTLILKYSPSICLNLPIL